MKKSITCILLSVSVVCSLFFSLPLTAFAATSYNMNINEPAKGTNQGYILLYIQGSSGTKQVQCISWTLFPIYTGDVSYYNATEMLIDVSNSSGTVSFIGRSSGAFQVSCGFGRALSGDSLRTTFWNVYDNNTAITYNYSLGSNTVLGYQVYGNGSVTSHDLGSNNNSPFTVSWGDDSGLTSKLTELIALATEMCDNDEKLLAELKNILSKVTSIDGTTSDILDDTGAILTNTADIERLCTSVISWLSQMDGRLKVIQGNTDNILKKLDAIISLLNGKGESTFEEPNTEGISEYDKAEDELVSGADDTSDIEQQIEDFEIDANASGKIWDIITQFFNCHPKIMGLVIGILCLGIIALILNR